MRKTYFASDFHLGIDSDQTSLEREKLIVEWLDLIAEDAGRLYLVGDIFDYWFEYKDAIPKGYSRFLAAIRRLIDKDIDVQFFTGNHDMWMFDYFKKEYGIQIHRAPITVQIGQHTFFIGHGDGLGDGDYGYKLIKAIFANKLCQAAFAFLHPRIGLGLMRFFSRRSRIAQGESIPFTSLEHERLYQFVKTHSTDKDIDLYIFGHRHLAIDCQLPQSGARYVNLGEWFATRSYAVYDGEKLAVQFYKNETGRIISE